MTFPTYCVASFFPSREIDSKNPASVASYQCISASKSSKQQQCETLFDSDVLALLIHYINDELYVIITPFSASRINTHLYTFCSANAFKTVVNVSNAISVSKY